MDILNNRMSTHIGRNGEPCGKGIQPAQRNRLKFVIWGVGMRGRRLLHFLGESRVAAFIDSDAKKTGTCVAGVPVISFDEYQASDMRYFIIVSPRFCTQIERFLIDNGISWYCTLSETPGTVGISGDVSFDDLPIHDYAKDLQVGIYGLNIYGLLLYEYMLAHGWIGLRLISDKGMGAERQMEEQFPWLPFIQETEKPDLILVASKHFQEAAERFPATRCEDMWDYTYSQPRYHSLKLTQVHHIHKDSRLFIVATGPSLRLSDLERLHAQREITMSVNTVYRCFSQTAWRPDYYVMADVYGLKQYGDEIKSLGIAAMFIPDTSQDFWRGGFEANNIYRYHSIPDLMQKWPRITDDIVKGIYEGGTVVLSCIQIAFYMGFSEIYLLGTDCTYNGLPWDKGNHFIDDYYAEGDNQPRNPFPIEESLHGYQAARFYAERHGIKIYNATRGGKLEVFERVDFDSLF